MQSSDNSHRCCYYYCPCSYHHCPLWWAYGKPWPDWSHRLSVVLHAATKWASKRPIVTVGHDCCHYWQPSLASLFVSEETTGWMENREMCPFHTAFSETDSMVVSPWEGPVRRRHCESVLPPRNLHWWVMTLRMLLVVRNSSRLLVRPTGALSHCHRCW